MQLSPTVSSYSIIHFTLAAFVNIHIPPACHSSPSRNNTNYQLSIVTDVFSPLLFSIQARILQSSVRPPPPKSDVSAVSRSHSECMDKKHSLDNLCRLPVKVSVASFSVISFMHIFCILPHISLAYSTFTIYCLRIIVGCNSKLFVLLNSLTAVVVF